MDITAADDFLYLGTKKVLINMYPILNGYGIITA
jgi:hypothetical protein